MKLTGERYELRSKSSNLVYWEQNEFPPWTNLNCLRIFPMAPSGLGVEPHYHDSDAIWLFRSGWWEVWVGEERYDVTPDTAVYTPMGVIHRFQMFMPYENTAIVTPLEGEKRPQHLIAGEDGTPVPSARGFVVPGIDNVDRFSDPGARCPWSEFREVSFSAGEHLAERAELTRNEHWIVSEGELEATVEDLTTTLTEEDIVLMRNGAVIAGE